MGYVNFKEVFMHIDIKPSNMLVNSQGHVKLCDFGVSVQLLTSLTKTFIGTNAYMAVSSTHTHSIIMTKFLGSFQIFPWSIQF